MDDYLNTKRQAQKMINEVIKINLAAGFHMHSWTSNVPKILPLQSNTKETRLCDKGEERVLGLFWDTDNDILTFNINCKKIPRVLLTGDKIPSKREVLRVVMSIFDPLGLLSPYTLKSKILLQEIWRSGVGWDDNIREEEGKAWSKWIKELEVFKQFKVPRCMSPVHFRYNNIQLHIFCDASLSAFATAAYLRFNDNDASTHVSLIMLKSRIAPLKSMTVPRLELQAALLGSRLDKFIQSECEFKIGKRYLWSDSSTVLTWIRSEPRARQVFVAHCLGEIAELTNVTEWRYVPSKENPADDATRFSNKALYEAGRWLNGPTFLHLHENEWPKEKTMSAGEKTSIEKMEQRKSYVGAVVATSIQSNSLPLTIKLLGSQGLLIVARRLWKAILTHRKIELTEQSSYLTLTICEQILYRVSQYQCFSNEINAIKSGKNIHKNSRLIQLKPFLDTSNVVRANGRVDLNVSTEFNKRPIILDSKHFATKALIRDYHRRFYHGSNNTVINDLRQKYYIVGLRNALRSLATRCIVCRLRKAYHFNPLMSGLPAGRVACRQRPFSHCGVDYFGPMIVKIGRRQEKRWALFTCLTTRAIHIELAHSLNTDSVIFALQRLAARRGVPLIMYSDRGTNFRGAEKELEAVVKLIDKEKLKAHALNK